MGITSEGQLVNAARRTILDALQATKGSGYQDQARIDLAKWVVLSMVAEPE